MLFTPKISSEGNYIIISNFPVKTFLNDCRRHFNTSKFRNILETMGWFGSKVKVHNFLLPELVFLMSKFPRYIYQYITDQLYKYTWLEDTRKYHESRIDISRLNNLKAELKSYQKEFLGLYDSRKQKYHLKGFILAFEQGLGKTLTSLALMDCLHKESVIIIAPKSTLRTVWQNEIERYLKANKDVWMVGDKPKKARFYIVNYESISKIYEVVSYVREGSVGLIVDESHNLRSDKAKRVNEVRTLTRQLLCDDILLMSGTPIKALGTEMIPTLSILDEFFDDEAKNIFKKSFGLNTEFALEVLNNRLGIMMHRKTKSEVLNLPDKTHHEVKIKIPNGNEYTAEAVKEKVTQYTNERRMYYMQNYNKYSNDYYECLAYVENKIGHTSDFKKYMEIVKDLKRYGYRIEVGEQVTWATDYEKNVIRPMLPPELRKKFDASKSVIKYVNLKIMGEVIGGLLNRLRASMFADMIKSSPTCEIIAKAEKKTICFTTYVDVAKQMMKYTSEVCKNKPILISGETSGNIKQLFKEFKDNEPVNPMVATVQTLATGVTLTEANTVIFINQPWRFTDRQQAEDRVHRIGQDTPVFVYTYILDTGGQPNLSTRMEDIVMWSKQMFEGIMGEEIPQSEIRSTLEQK